MCDKAKQGHDVKQFLADIQIWIPNIIQCSENTGHRKLILFGVQQIFEHTSGATIWIA